MHVKDTRNAFPRITPCIHEATDACNYKSEMACRLSWLHCVRQETGHAHKHLLAEPLLMCVACHLFGQTMFDHARCLHLGSERDWVQQSVLLLLHVIGLSV